MTFKRIVLIIFCNILITQPAAGTEKEYQKLYRMGVEYNKSGNIEEAIKLYSKAIKQKNDSPELYFVRGRAYKQIERYDLAFNDINHAIILKKDYADAYNLRGILYIGKGEQNKALTDFKKACSLGHSDGCRNANKLESSSH